MFRKVAAFFGLYLVVVKYKVPGQVKTRAFMKIFFWSCGHARLNVDLCMEVLKFGLGLFA